MTPHEYSRFCRLLRIAIRKSKRELTPADIGIIAAKIEAKILKGQIKEN